jgi:hypothetical protein
LEQQKFVTPLKVGLLTVTLAYFLFTLHQTFMFTWIGEWEGLPPPLSFWIFITDVVAGVFLVFRFIASLIAVTAVILYFAKRGLPQSKTYKLIRIIIVFEGLYWIGLLPSGIWGLIPTQSGFNMGLLLTTGIPCIFSSIAIPIALFILAAKLKPDKPQAIKWAWIAGLFYLIDFWLVNTGSWLNLVTSQGRGLDYLVTNTEYLFSFALTVGGLLTLIIYTGYSAKKSMATHATEGLKLWPVGVVITALGLYYLWNYLAWIFFGGFNDWYAWFLGHNLDLWMLTLPLVGLPLLFYRLNHSEATEA